MAADTGNREGLHYPPYHRRLDDSSQSPRRPVHHTSGYGDIGRPSAANPCPRSIAFPLSRYAPPFRSSLPEV